MADETKNEDAPLTLYAQLDTEIDGTHYNVGDPIAADLHVGTREVLKARGDIGTTKPVTEAMPAPAGMKVEDMNRDQVIAAIRAETPFHEASDDELRSHLSSLRAKSEADAAAADEAAKAPTKPQRGRTAPES